MTTFYGTSLSGLRYGASRGLSRVSYDGTDLDFDGMVLGGAGAGSASDDVPTVSQASGLISSASDWSSLPSKWWMVKGDSTEPGPTHAFAASGMTLAMEKDSSYGDGGGDPVGVTTLHTSNAYTATVELTNFTNMADVVSGKIWKCMLVHQDGPGGAASAFGGISVRYHGADSTFYVQKRTKLGGVATDTTSGLSAIATPTGIKLRNVWLDGSGIKTYYAIDTGAGYGSFIEVDSGYSDIQGLTGTPLGPPAPRMLGIWCSSNDATLAAAVSVRVDDFAVTGAS